MADVSGLVIPCGALSVHQTAVEADSPLRLGLCQSWFMIGARRTPAPPPFPYLMTVRASRLGKNAVLSGRLGAVVQSLTVQ